MSSWREDTSPEAQQQMDAITNVALSVAIDRLTESPELAPFALTLAPEGDFQVIGAYEGDDAQPTDLLNDLFAGLRADRSQHTVVAVVSDVTLQGQDAIQVHIEHSEPTAPALVMALPYQRGDTGPTTGDLKATSGQRRVWS